MENFKISLIVPMYNEKECVSPFYSTVKPIMEKLNQQYEIIFIDDGSKDQTLFNLKELAKKDSTVKILSFSKNFGQQAGLLAGLKHATGDLTINLDCDLQDDPSVIPQMIEKWQEGFKIVLGKRKSRKKDSFFKRLTAKLYYFLYRKLTKINLPKDVADFRLLDREVVDQIVGLKEYSRSLKTQSLFVGYKQTEVLFDRQARVAGKTKLNFNKLVKIAMATIIPNSDCFLKLPLTLGVATFCLSALGAIALVILLCLSIPFSSLLYIVLLMVFLTSIILICMGLTNLYISNIYKEVQQRPVYIVEEKINF